SHRCGSHRGWAFEAGVRADPVHDGVAGGVAVATCGSGRWRYAGAGTALTMPGPRYCRKKMMTDTTTAPDVEKASHPSKRAAARVRDIHRVLGTMNGAAFVVHWLPTGLFVACAGEPRWQPTPSAGFLAGPACSSARSRWSSRPSPRCTST